MVLMAAIHAAARLANVALRFVCSLALLGGDGSLGRNDPCHCGSGKKYKKCHLRGDEARELRVGDKVMERIREAANLDNDGDN
jgi:hypothetical protein